MKNLGYIIFVILLSFLLIGCDQTGGSSAGGKAPEISAGKWINSKPLKLENLKGKIVVVEFFATWCPPCKQSIPHLIKMNKGFKSKNVIFISISNEKYSTVKPFVDSMKIDYAVAVESNTGNKYGVSGIPAAFIVDAKGNIAWKGHPMSGLEAKLKTMTE